MATLADRQEAYRNRQRYWASLAVRRETALERMRRLKPGWDWRNGGRAERNKVAR